MKILLKISILILVTNFSTVLFAQDLEEWIGDYPFKKFNGNTFFQKTDKLLSFNKVLPSKEYKYLTGDKFLYVYVTKIDSFLVTSRCRPHCCPCENLWLAIKLNSNKFICVYHDHPDDTVHVVHCYGRGLSIAQLPDSLKEDLLFYQLEWIFYTKMVIKYIHAINGLIQLKQIIRQCQLTRRSS